MDLSGIDFIDITDLAPLYLMDDLTDLWLVNTRNIEAAGLDALLDNLETIEGTATEGVLYMTQADFVDGISALPPILDLLGEVTDKESKRHVISVLAGFGSAAHEATPKLLEILRGMNREIYYGKTPYMHWGECMLLLN